MSDSERRAQTHHFIEAFSLILEEEVSLRAFHGGVPAPAIALELSRAWCKQYMATMQVVEQIHNTKSSTGVEAAVALRELASSAAAVAASSITMLLQTEVQISDLEMQKPL